MKRLAVLLWVAALLPAPPSLGQTRPAAKHAHTVPVVAPKHAAPVRRRVAEAARPRHAAHAVVAPVHKPPPHPLPPPVPDDVGTSTGLHLPRYASLKSGEVNMRSGPGERYPILWVYKRRALPVEIEREFDVWRYVEDMDGVKGWIQQAFIAGKRSFVITGTEARTLRAAASDTADPVAMLKPGVVGRLTKCAAGADWCQVQVEAYGGWLKRGDFWGTAPGEAVSP